MAALDAYEAFIAAGDPDDNDEAQNAWFAQCVALTDARAAELRACSQRVRRYLIPVEVFGGSDIDGERWGYGLCDAVSAWSDCNRAGGHIYRFEDLGDAPSEPPKYREPGDFLAVWVDADEFAAFSAKKFGDPWVDDDVKFTAEHHEHIDGGGNSHCCSCLRPWPCPSAQGEK